MYPPRELSLEGAHQLSSSTSEDPLSKKLINGTLKVQSCRQVGSCTFFFNVWGFQDIFSVCFSQRCEITWVMVFFLSPCSLFPSSLANESMSYLTWQFYRNGRNGLVVLLPSGEITPVQVGCCCFLWYLVQELIQIQSKNLNQLCTIFFDYLHYLSLLLWWCHVTDSSSSFKKKNEDTLQNLLPQAWLSFCLFVVFHTLKKMSHLSHLIKSREYLPLQQIAAFP